MYNFLCKKVVVFLISLFFFWVVGVVDVGLIWKGLVWFCIVFWGRGCGGRGKGVKGFLLGLFFGCVCVFCGGLFVWKGIICSGVLGKCIVVKYYFGVEFLELLFGLSISGFRVNVFGWFS